MPFQVGDRVRGKYSRTLGTIQKRRAVYDVQWDEGGVGENSEDWLEPAPARPRFQIGDMVREPDFSSQAMEVFAVSRRTQGPGLEYTLRIGDGDGKGFHWAEEADLEAA